MAMKIISRSSSSHDGRQFFRITEWDGKVDGKTGKPINFIQLGGKVDNILDYVEEHLDDGWELLAIKTFTTGMSWHLRKRDKVEPASPPLGEIIDLMKMKK